MGVGLKYSDNNGSIQDPLLAAQCSVPLRASAFALLTTVLKITIIVHSPSVVAPHQPRLDWQMWFAALGHYTDNPWLVNLVYKLLVGEKDG